MGRVMHRLQPQHVPYLPTGIFVAFAHSVTEIPLGMDGKAYSDHIWQAHRSGDGFVFREHASEFRSWRALYLICERFLFTSLCA